MPVPKKLFFGMMSLTVAYAGSATAIRQAPVSSYVSVGAPLAMAWFGGGGSFAFSGGVSPQARAVIFYDSDNKKIEVQRLDLNAEATNVYIAYNEKKFQLPMPLGIACSLAAYIQRGGKIAFTIPERDDSSFFSSNGLIPYQDTNAYVAKEFARPEFANFLKDLDLADITSSMPSNIKRALMNEINSANGVPGGKVIDPSGWDSYVNSDFHVTYSAYLVWTPNGGAVDIAGLPLRYFWSVQPSGKALIHDVHVFDFPSSNNGLLYNSVLFFQNAAVFGQFKAQDRGKFNLFRQRVCARP